MTSREAQFKILKAVDGALRLSAPFLAADPGRLAVFSRLQHPAESRPRCDHPFLGWHV
jgi:hypothetical protein